MLNWSPISTHHLESNSQLLENRHDQSVKCVWCNTAYFSYKLASSKVLLYPAIFCFSTHFPWCYFHASGNYHLGILVHVIKTLPTDATIGRRASLRSGANKGYNLKCGATHCNSLFRRNFAVGPLDIGISVNWLLLHKLTVILFASDYPASVQRRWHITVFPRSCERVRFDSVRFCTHRHIRVSIRFILIFSSLSFHLCSDYYMIATE